MNKPEWAKDYRDNFPSLITNDNMEINFSWDLWGAEVDQLAVAIKGDKEEITEDEIVAFLAGVLDSIVMNNVLAEDKRALALLAQEKEGKSPEYIVRYIRGWDNADKALTGDL